VPSVRTHATQTWSNPVNICEVPPLENIEGDPRYKAFLEKMNLPE